ncbi:hypothetical protein EST38_g1710 [Candolleomyces aberdarensis]|uniref:Uncharacterized protein n=1 Tax=Candolleomyces aberdarensis TaxID=2316362 RepID=A0A4Q2DXU4_9AGAR|nr:hypothetical protein EST38_g1710 [Candolleomyces aberdarensis]
MEAALQSPPPLQSISDEDRYNAEYASIHFGSFAAPEHKIATVDDPQPPLPSNPEPQDSQSPTLQPDVIDTDKETEQEDSEDVERVEELVGGADVEGLLTLDTDIPFSADYVDDEPSSALALRISRAMDNPSPPPSPLPNEDTLPTELTEADANDNDQDLPAEDALAPPEIPPASPSPTPPQPTDSHMDVEDPVPSSPSPQQDLITFDSVSALEIPFVIKPQDDNANPPDSAISAVEAMLLPSPSDSPVDPSTSEAPIAPTVDEPETELALPHPNLAPETNGLSPPSTPPTQPLRRSPRKSVAPVIFGTPQGTPRPSSRSPKKKKPKFDLVVDNSQDESDDVTPENVLLPIQPNSTTAQDATATPARRIPIEQALESGQLSPLKASQMGFKPQSTLPGLPQTPARRVLVSEQPAQAPASAKPAIRIGSPVRGRSQEPQASTASTSGQIGISSIAQRTALGVHAVSSHSIASSSAASARPSKLPFPLVAAEKPPSASTSSDKDTSKESASISSPVKSNLKQVSSRIPRIGAKPYSRPPTAAKPTKQTPAPAPAPAPKPSSIRKVDLSKPSTTRMPTLRIRKVVDPVPPPAPVAPPPPPVPQAQQPIQPAQPTAQMIFNKEPTQTHGEAEAAHIEVAPMPVDGGLDLGSPMKEDPPTQPLVRPLSPPAPPPVPVPSIPVIQIDPPTETPPIETLHPSEIPQPIQGVRRTTRLRKATVDCAATGAEPRATSSRRKASQGPRFVFTDAYSEMSVTALKQLTMTNTVRNQHYLSAKLELEVIKKDGARPESPMVKIKTIAQRQLEEQAEQRTERAKRRARRSGEMLGESDLEMDESDNEGYSSDVDELPSLEKEQKMRHTRGAGEDEDYETPHRAFKRMKLTEGGLEEVEMDEAKRRVKWDRGLFTTVYLDEVVLGDRQLTKEHRSLKGCLAPTAKALRLDTLGNLEADSPLSDLASQNIVVKKFVYEGELVPEPVVEEVEVPKTRSRSKKAKS